MLYHYQTKRINETVTRNKERFPENFCFQLTNEECIILKSQIATSLETEDILLLLNSHSLFVSSKKNNNSLFVGC